MSTITDDLNDSLDDLIGLDVTAPKPARPIPEHFKPIEERMFTEPCQACGGSGKFRSWSGRTVGDCFKCKGSGHKTFKTSPEKRAKGRVSAAHAAVKREEKRAREAADFILANEAMVAWLRASAQRNAERNGTFDFPQKMLDTIAKFGALTDGQKGAVEKLMARDAERKAKFAAERQAREANAPVVDASKLEKAFATAKEKASRKGQMGVWVKPLLAQSSEETGKQNLQFQAGSAGSQWEGQIFVKTRDGKKLGAIKNGKFTRRFECSDAEEVAVVDVCNDPLKAAVAFGKAWSICAVCSKTLTNDGSIERGIGPVCAEKFGW